jgi:hypothetical protein
MWSGSTVSGKGILKEHAVSIFRAKDVGVKVQPHCVEETEMNTRLTKEESENYSFI